jgi:hypothetical protein
MSENPKVAHIDVKESAVKRREVELYAPGSFETSEHFYPRVLNAQIHPLVRYFLSLSNEQIIERFCHLRPTVFPDVIGDILRKRTKHFHWGGADLFHTTTKQGNRRLVVIETNSSPSGQKSMPFISETGELAGYRTLIEKAFLPLLHKKTLSGGLAVVYDKNEMETRGYAAVLAELTNENVYFVPFFQDDLDPPVRFTGPEQVMEIRTNEGEWKQIRAALRYVTQKPWNRIPVVSKTILFNPILVCLAGGRNKLLAAKAYDFYNADLRNTGLAIRTPETIWDVALQEVPLWVRRMGGIAVVKNPYSNAGQGVWTIASEAELAAFMEIEHHYDRFIVQSLIGNANWSSESLAGLFYHVGTVPDRRNRIFVADIRFMVGNGPDGFFPVALYARRARKPLVRELDAQASSWDMLGTNLSVKNDDGTWTTESNRLLLMDSRDFNKIGLGLDDLIESYIQTILSVSAIDQMSQNLLTQRNRFRRKFFKSLNPDDVLMNEIMRDPNRAAVKKSGGTEKDQ